MPNSTEPESLDLLLALMSQHFVVRLWHIAGECLAKRFVVERKPREPFAAAQAINAVMRGNGQEPRREFLIGVALFQFRVRPQESFLRRVLGILCVAQHAVRQVVHRRLVRFDQLSERVWIAALSALHEQLLFQRLPLT